MTETTTSPLDETEPYDPASRRPTGRDVSSLPKWASAYIERLERDLGDWRTKALVGPVGSNVALWHVDSRKPLGRNAQIEFYLDELVQPDRRPPRFDVTITADGAGISVRHTGGQDFRDGLVIHPHVTNSIEIRPGERVWPRQEETTR